MNVGRNVLGRMLQRPAVVAGVTRGQSFAAGTALSYASQRRDFVQGATPVGSASSQLVIDDEHRMFRYVSSTMHVHSAFKILCQLCYGFIENLFLLLVLLYSL